MKDDTNYEDLDISDGGTLFVKEWWNMHGSATPQLQHLTMLVLAQLMNTSSVERCLANNSIYCFGPLVFILQCLDGLLLIVVR